MGLENLKMKRWTTWICAFSFEKCLLALSFLFCLSIYIVYISLLFSLVLLSGIRSFLPNASLLGRTQAEY